MVAALLTTLGVVLNRVNVVALAMNLERREAAVRAGAILAVDLRMGRVDRSHRGGHLPLGLGARLWPMLPKNAAAARPSTH